MLGKGWFQPIRRRLSPHALDGMKESYGDCLTYGLGKRFRDYDYRDTIIILGMPRSGTTWVQSVINRGLRGCTCFEPLHSKEDWKAQRVNPHDLITESLFTAPAEALLTEYMQGQRWTRWSSRNATLRDLLVGRPIVLKEVRTAAAVRAIASSFPENAVLYVFRNPYDVVRSMMIHSGGWHEWPLHVLNFEPDALAHELWQTATKVPSPRAGLYAAVWCLSTYVALQVVGTGHVRPISYEALGTAPEASLRGVLNWQERDLRRALRVVKEPSVTVGDSGATEQYGSLEAESVSCLLATLFSSCHWDRDLKARLAALIPSMASLS